MRQRLAESFETALPMPTAAPWRWRWTPAPNTCSRRASPARCAATRCRSSSRGCSRSTTRWAPARSATASARSVLRPGARRRLPAPVARLRRHPRLGPAQPVLLPAAGQPGRPLRLRHRAALRGAAEEHRQIVLYGSGREKIPSATCRKPAAAASRSTPSRASCPTSSAATRKPTRSPVREELAKYLNTKPCPECEGTRLRSEARHVLVGGRNLPQVSAGCRWAPARDFFNLLPSKAQRAQVAEKIVREITARLGFLINVGLDYLSLDRSADTLSGGEAQRIRLASQIGSGLTGVMYVLDEPSIGLHQRDNARLLGHAGRAARPRQHGDRRRARRGGHPRRRPRGRHGPRRRRARRPHRRRGHAGRDRRLPGLADRRLPLRPPRHRRAEEAPRRPTRRGCCASAARTRQQPARQVDAGDLPVGPAHLRHRRLRLGQVHADQRHALRRRRAPPLRLAAPSRRRTTRSRGWTSSTR
jgi:hypothetical protein